MLQICLNENQVPSTIPSLTSSISSFSSFNVIDNWQTSPGPGIGAWSAGPPLSILRSPTLGIAPNYRRGSSPFSSSPQNSPNLNRRKGGLPFIGSYLKKLPRFKLNFGRLPTSRRSTRTSVHNEIIR